MSVEITYFVHGTTTDNEKDLATGWLPGELSELGLGQSRDLKMFLKNKKFDLIFCSDLKRAVDSAQIVFGDRYKIIQDESLREANYGDFNGKPCKDFKKGRMNNYVEKSFPKGESYKDVEKRMEDFLKFLEKNYQGKQVAIVAHEGPQLALGVLLRRKNWAQVIEENWRNRGEWKPGWKYVL